MKDTRQRVAIAEACGWINQGTAKQIPALEHRWTHKDIHPRFINTEELPDYPNDLNAMHEAEKMLNPEQRKIYSERLSFLLRDQESRQPFYDLMFVTLHAPAHFRAKAFLQTIKKWKDSEPLNSPESKGTEVTCKD